MLDGRQANGVGIGSGGVDHKANAANAIFIFALFFFRLRRQPRHYRQIFQRRHIAGDFLHTLPVAIVDDDHRAMVRVSGPVFDIVLERSGEICCVAVEIKPRAHRARVVGIWHLLDMGRVGGRSL